MSSHEFTLILDHAPSGEELDALFEAGCDDSTPETVAGNGRLHFDRAADTLLQALTPAIRDVESTGLTVCAVASEDLVSLKDIATRTARTYESARLLATGKRGPGGFPPPVTTADGILGDSPPTARRDPATSREAVQAATMVKALIADGTGMGSPCSRMTSK